MRRVSRRGWLLAWAGLVVCGCISPTLPLPPPSPPDVEKIGEGQYAVRGTIPVQGDVIIVNQRTDLVYGKFDVTVYEVVVAAKPGDGMLVYYVSGQDKSDAVPFRIEAEPSVPDAGVAPDADRDADAARD